MTGAGDVSPEAFTDIELVRGDRRVVWEYIGEGRDGDYRPDNPADVPLLRFSCFRRTGADEWEPLPCGSYCTCMPATAPMHVLVAAAAEILETVICENTYRKRLEQLSWMCLDDFKTQRQELCRNVAGRWQ